MLKFLKKHVKWCILAPLFMIGEVLMDLFQPDLMANIVDNGVLKGDMDLILSIGVRMIIFVILGGLSGILSGVCANMASQRFGNDLRKELFKKTLSLSFNTTDKISTGSLVTRLSNDVSQVQMMVAMSIRGMIRSSIMFIGGIVMLYRQAPSYAAVAAIALPIFVVVVLFFLKKASPMFSKVQTALDGVNNVMQEDVAGARVVKAYVKEKYEENRFDEANKRLCGVNLKVATLLAYMHPCMNIILNLCVVAIIYIGGVNVSTGGEITPGQTMAAITYITMILNGVLFLTNIFQTFTRARASVDRVKEVLNVESEISDGTFDGETETHGEIEFKNVSFAYADGENVLDDINLKISKGETLAVLGETGSGKSTLINLIPRFYDVKSGEILVDGVNVRDYKLDALRNKISVVLQKAELYSRSVAENIRWGKRNADLFEIKQAAIDAQADDFICEMPFGYNTDVSEGGHSLSGGQKQRLSIARGLIKRAEILIFDDATSALDLKTEARLYEALRTSYADTTKIIIAQRIASVKDADRIAVLDGGKIVACAPHDELMQTCGIYKDIYDSQLKGEDGNEKE